MRTSIYIFGVMLAGVCLFSCKKGEEPCYDAFENVADGNISFSFKDSATDRDLYYVTMPAYNRDSISFSDLSGKNLMFYTGRQPVGGTGEYQAFQVRFYNTETDNISFEREVCKEIIIKFSAARRDTAIVCFLSRRDPCISQFSVLRVRYRNRLVSEFANTTSGSALLSVP